MHIERKITLKKRIITGVLASAFFIAMLLGLYTRIFPLFVCLLSGIAVFEINKVIDLKYKPLRTLSLLMAAILPLCITYVHFFRFFPFIIIYVILMLSWMLGDYEHTKFTTVASSIFASISVPFALTVMVLLRDLFYKYPNKFSRYDGLYFLIMALFCAWMTDIFAYFVGVKFGKHKMSPNISPKKSVEGAIGGIIGCVLLNVALCAVFRAYFPGKSPFMSYIAAVPLSAVLSVTGMLGDLSASVIKRNFGVKDYGNILPGHGGVMDRFDSVIFVLPVLYAIIMMWIHA